MSRSFVLFATYCVPRVLASRPKLAEPCPVLPASSGETVSMYRNGQKSEESSDEGDCEHEGGCRRLTNGDTLH